MAPAAVRTWHALQGLRASHAFSSLRASGGAAAVASDLSASLFVDVAFSVAATRVPAVCWVRWVSAACFKDPLRSTGQGSARRAGRWLSPPVLGWLCADRWPGRGRRPTLPSEPALWLHCRPSSQGAGRARPGRLLGVRGGLGLTPTDAPSPPGGGRPCSAAGLRLGPGGHLCPGAASGRCFQVASRLRRRGPCVLCGGHWRWPVLGRPSSCGNVPLTWELVRGDARLALPHGCFRTSCG